MKEFKPVRLDKRQARRELDEFRDLLADPKTPELKEREHILPFFAGREHLVALMGTYNPRIENFDRIAFEFDIFGDHTADVAVGDSKTHQYCFIGFEDATATSIFKKNGRKTTLEWSDRFDLGPWRDSRATTILAGGNGTATHILGRDPGRRGLVLGPCRGRFRA